MKTMSDDATGSVFLVQTTIPYGDPAKGQLLRLVIQATVDASCGEMAHIVETEHVLIGDHLLMDRDLSTDKEHVVFRREPIAVPASKVGYIKPFNGRVIQHLRAPDTGMTSHHTRSMR